MHKLFFPSPLEGEGGLRLVEDPTCRGANGSQRGEGEIENADQIP